MTFYELQTDYLAYLNDNCVENDFHIIALAEMLNIIFIDEDDKHGWYIENEID